MPMVTTNPVQKSTLFSAKKTTLLTRKRAFCLTDGFEWVLGSWVHEQFILAPFVIAIGHGLDGGYWFLYGGWRLGVNSLLSI